MLTSFLIFNIYFIIVFWVVIIQINKKSNLGFGDLGRVFIYGASGWILAYLRVILIQLYQLLILTRHNIDYRTITAAQLAENPLIYTYEFNIMGPVLAGAIEEGVRFLIIANSRTRQNKSTFLVTSGLGWAFGEILIITLPAIYTDFSGINFYVSIYERTIASIIHVMFAFIVFLSLFEKKKISLWLAMFMHFLVDFILLVLILELNVDDGVTWILIIEGVLTVVVALMVIFTKFYWWPRQMAKIRSEES